MTTTDDRAERGLGLYLEFRGTNDLDHVSQYLVIPEMISPVTGDIISFRFLARVLTTANPRRMWRPIGTRGDYTTHSKTVGTSPKTFLKTMSIDDAIEYGATYLGGPISSLDSVATTGWTLYRKPLVIAISDADAADIERLETPRGLMERLARLRTAEGFEDLPKGKE